MGGLPARRRHPRWWSAVLIALATVTALVVPPSPSHDISLATYNLPLAPAQPLDPTAVAAVVEPSVVQIDTRIDYQQAVGTGTGIVVGPDGEVLTNFHVVQ